MGRPFVPSGRSSPPSSPLARLTAAFNPLRGLPSPLPRREPPPVEYGEEVSPKEERAMRNLWWDGLFAESSEIIWLQYFAIYALSLGASIGFIGALAAIGNLVAALSMWPGSVVAERTRRYKLIVLVFGGVGSRLAILALAFVPWIATGDAALGILIVIAALRGCFANIAIPAWSAFAAEFVPAALRGRYFASRNLVRQFADLSIVPLAGFVIFRVGGDAGWQTVWLLAFLLGMASTAFYMRIPSEREFVDRAPPPHTGSQARYALLGDRRLLWFVATSSCFQLSVMLAGPFFGVYLVRELGSNTLWVGITAAAMPLGGMIAQPLLGRLNDRLGPKWLLVTSGLLLPVAPWLWMLVDEPWQVIFINLIAGVLWSANLLATLNLVLEIAPPEKRASYSGLQQGGIFFASFVGPLAGGLLVAAIGFKLVFFLSGAGRLLATLLLWRFVSDAGGRRSALEPEPAIV